MAIRTEELRYDSRDRETKIYAKKWIPEGTPRAILQIVHGMSEAIDRYDEYAQWMAERGIMVIGNDHLGHGSSVADENSYGYFAEKDGNTLVVVTADHETGGLVLKSGDIEKGLNECKYITDGHSGVMVPVFSYGPGAETFSGIQNNIDLMPKMLKAMGRKSTLK